MVSLLEPGLSKSRSTTREGFLGLFNRFLRKQNEPSLEAQAYIRLRNKGFNPASIIDVGAYEGHWTELARKIFPNAAVIMVEAQPGKANALLKVAERLGNVKLVNSLLASKSGEEVMFYEMETGSSFLPENSNVTRTERKLVSLTLDDIADDQPSPVFLKIDTQGAELAILAGGQKTLSKCEVVQLETALLPYNEGAPEIVEVLSQMKAWGFVPYDFAGFIRPHRTDLVQTDIVFVREDSVFRQRSFEFDV